MFKLRLLLLMFSLMFISCTDRGIYIRESTDRNVPLMVIGVKYVSFADSWVYMIRREGDFSNTQKLRIITEVDKGWQVGDVLKFTLVEED